MCRTVNSGKLGWIFSKMHESNPLKRLKRLNYPISFISCKEKNDFSTFFWLKGVNPISLSFCRN